MLGAIRSPDVEFGAIVELVHARGVQHAIRTDGQTICDPVFRQPQRSVGIGCRLPGVRVDDIQSAGDAASAITGAQTVQRRDGPRLDRQVAHPDRLAVESDRPRGRERLSRARVDAYQSTCGAGSGRRSAVQAAVRSERQAAVAFGGFEIPALLRLLEVRKRRVPRSHLPRIDVDQHQQAGVRGAGGRVRHGDVQRRHRIRVQQTPLFELFQTESPSE